jgi:hypothetical protein
MAPWRSPVGRAVSPPTRARAVAPGSRPLEVNLNAPYRIFYNAETIKSQQQALLMVAHAEPGAHKPTFRHGDAIMTREVPAGRLGMRLANARAERDLPNRNARPTRGRNEIGCRSFTAVR